MRQDAEPTLICKQCTKSFQESDFDRYSHEYDHTDGLCPSCSAPSLVCSDCDKVFSELSYDGIDDEYSDDNLCPICSEKTYIEGKTCDYCDNPAVTSVGTDILCEDCYEQYGSND